VTAGKRGLEAPHRRLERGPRILEKVAVRAWAVATWVVARVPGGLARRVIGAGTQASYLLWPTKRAWSNANFAHVTGLPPNDRRVRRLALAAYREYARYLVEVMHLESLPLEHAEARVTDTDLDHIERAWRESPGGLIFALGHVGNNEAVAAAVANRGWPISVVADDTAFPEMFERFRKLRESWGVHIVPWRNLREIYAVLRRKEMLGLLVDWGYRADGIPVRLFDAWTTLPAGPAWLAARTNSRILPVAIRRRPDGLFRVSFAPIIEVRSTSPADAQRATQALADSLAATIGAAPEQWYSFKPIWPATAEEAAELERRAAAMLAGVPDAAGPAAEPAAALDTAAGLDGPAAPAAAAGLDGPAAPAAAPSPPSEALRDAPTSGSAEGRPA
jgi:phosphatidylinositol dimannoside acyltransferase